MLVSDGRALASASESAYNMLGQESGASRQYSSTRIGRMSVPTRLVPVRAAFTDTPLPNIVEISLILRHHYIYRSNINVPARRFTGWAALLGVVLCCKLGVSFSVSTRKEDLYFCM